MEFEARLIGGKELEEVLKKLPEKVNKRILNSAARLAAKPLIKSARRKVPKRTRNLEKSIGTRIKGRTGNQSVAMIGPQTGKRRRYDGWYAHFVEFGVSGISRKKKKRYRVDVAAKPFMRPAYDETKGEMQKEYGNYVGKVTQKFLEKEAEKMNRKSKK